MILLVSRHEDTLVVFGDALRHAGFTVREVRDPAEVLRSVATERPSLVITNFPMAAGAATVTELLRSDARTHAIPILNVTSRVLPEELRRASEAGVNASLPMPVSLSQLLAEVRRLLETAPSPDFA